ncbi:MAG TPA: hypothetical protein VH395_13780 [Jatrophihabitantaceae bacterium]|jgi:hypothetical protein
MATRTGVCVVRAEQEGDGVLVITVSSTLDVEIGETSREIVSGIDAALRALTTFLHRFQTQV